MNAPPSPQADPRRATIVEGCIFQCFVTYNADSVFSLFQPTAYLEGIIDTRLLMPQPCCHVCQSILIASSSCVVKFVVVVYESEAMIFTVIVNTEQPCIGVFHSTIQLGKKPEKLSISFWN